MDFFDKAHNSLRVMLVFVGLIAAGCSSGFDTGFSDCSTSETGCPCAQGTVTACYGDEASADEDGALYCLQGVRHCLNGTWGECELEGGDVQRMPIIGDPQGCLTCDPACFYSLDAPVTGELTDVNS
jgi:hypothetical protein